MSGHFNHAAHHADRTPNSGRAGHQLAQSLRGLSAVAMLWLVASWPCSANPPASDAGSPNTKIYKYLKGGAPTFSDVPPSKGGFVVFQASCYACNLSSTIDWHSTQLHIDAYRDEINLAAQQFDVDPALVRAVIHAESGFNASARSPKGATGLMQLMPGTARMLGVVDARVPSYNILGGVKYLASLLVRFKHDIGLATAAYNAGPEAVRRHAGVPPYTETQVYVQRVKILYKRYQDQLRG